MIFKYLKIEKPIKILGGKLCLAVFLIFNISFCQSPSKEIKVLIVDGFSNHDWKQTSFLVKNLLENSGLFKVQITTVPIEIGSKSWQDWNPNFGDYHVIIQNTNNIHDKKLRWNMRAECNLENYLKAGGGLLILHSANNAFSDWQEYNRIIGLGWRSKKEGYAIQIEENGKLKYIPEGVGKDTYHGPRNNQIIKILNNHPINIGFPNAWQTPDMELYKFARGPAKDLTVLSYATDSITQLNWPVEWVVQYGKGRVYNSSMGHLWSGDDYPVSYRCIGFQTTLIRAAEWLATGETTYNVPQNFPDEHRIQLNTIGLLKK